jgi:hypothetical protein
LASPAPLGLICGNGQRKCLAARAPPGLEPASHPQDRGGFHRSADTHLIPVPLPAYPGVDLYFKDESSHPTGSLKHRLARSLFLYSICNGWYDDDWVARHGLVLGPATEAIAQSAERGQALPWPLGGAGRLAPAKEAAEARVAKVPAPPPLELPGQQ